MLDEVRWIRNRVAGCLAVCTVLVSQAWADPNIQVSGVQGSFDDGALITITGQGFGTKVPAQPFLWDDFEGHTPGQLVGNPVVGAYSRVGVTEYSATYPYSGDGCAYSPILGTPDGPGLVAHWIPAEVANGFASMKYRLISSSGSMAPHNVKLLRLNAHDPDPTHGYPNYNIGKERTAVNYYGIVNHGLMGLVYFGGFNEPADADAWTSLSIWDHMGDPDVANGFAGREINGVMEERHNIVTLQSGHLNGLRAAYFCGYVSHEGFDVDLYLDDVYADVTLARVLVRDPDGGNIEMQIPQSWSPNSIQVLVNTGAYPSGTELDLIVYAADNYASAPFVVTVGESSGGGDLGPPGMPSTPYFE